MRADTSHPSVGRVSLPEVRRSPWWELGRRLLAAMSILVGTVLLVYLDRDGYRDGNDPTNTISWIDAIYYTTVTLSTTGYGDIAPVSDQARLVNAFVITPARIAFLVLLIGTTLEVLASQGREMFRVARWRKKMDQHVVVVGYGTKGRSAIETLVNNGYDRESIVVVDPGPVAMEEANRDQLVGIAGDATRRGVLRQAGVEKATHVIITTDRDDSNVLVTLTVRQLNPDAWIVASVREQENVPLMRQSGANSVITSSDAVGRLLGLSSMSPMLGSVMEDLMTYGEGLEVAERDLLVNEVGKQPQRLPDQVIAVVRDEKVYRYFDPVVSLLARGDRLIVVRPAKELPWAPRPGTHGEDSADEDV
ncbi:potassium channel family protein [Nocardioides xinjiangensis]|uniref:potassium channel family protein n=1 Tax=Nocardioides xinjiangensis TaxID=2817376 RepID=UPI0027DDAA83|nr:MULTISPECIES: potassium channel family protein [unclassified Nocardioides]